MAVRRKILAGGGLALAVIAAPALAQTTGSGGMASFQNGYGGARQSVTTAQTGSTRDQNGNRLIVDGIIQAGASAYSAQSGGVSQTWSGSGNASGGSAIGGSTAIGNNLNVVVQGSHNTVIVNSRQTNTGNVSARTDLTGTLTGF
ncbi:holdfast anchoring protein HfaA [Brevundimonas subvibrioides]|uniref:Holdfast attachment protein HfaA n=1 Tax=Brevundimonas subvibrioides (strain ATCC 15264 / DSM 4735 / LMG 14903 / NBRC 16000 / CB 81) TaxID=633149 RepID=D9QMC6_BRESC|nr:holdfast anchoring protein HfaA [Brevundimonas subvibrioides]ADL02052.1 holdfast attachment protein HfaA [Brevundimonas subvibrioides ATCC 15264]